MRKILTPKQKLFLDFLRSYMEEHGYAPSQQVIAQHFQFRSLGTVQNYLNRLEIQGHLQKTWNARHGITLREEEELVKGPSSALLPLLGLVAAGSPIEAIENEEFVEVPSSMLGSGNYFVLRVQGDSMVEDGILDKDLAIIRKQSRANNGEIVVALIDDSATIKKYYRYPKRIELHPANAAYEPIVIDREEKGKEIKVQGIFVGLIRSMKHSYGS